MQKKLDLFKPSPYFAWAVHIDGLRERHDQSVCRDGVFDKAVDAIAEAKRRGFRAATNTTFFTHDAPETVRRVLDFLNDELEVDAMMISPAYAYEKAPDQEHFLGVEQTRRLFREAFADGRRRRWRLNHTTVPRLPRGQVRLQLHGVGDRLGRGICLGYGAGAKPTRVSPCTAPGARLFPRRGALSLRGTLLVPCLPSSLDD